MLAWAVACALGAACSSPSEPHGSPILTQVYWVADGAQLLAWSRPDDPDPAQVSPVPAFASEIDFVFDRRLDGSRLEDIVTVGGLTTARPKATPAVHASWPDMAAAMSEPPFALVVDYNSLATFGGVSAYVFARPVVPGFPSDTTVTFALDTTLLTSAYGDPANVPATIPVKTKAFAVSLVSGGAPVASSYQLPLAFSNRLPAVPATSPFIHVMANGATVPYKLLADAGQASRWFLGAADCLGGWPASTIFTVTIDAGLPDAFGGKLAQAATATFTTAGGASAPDASCSIPDAGPPDSGADAGPPDSGADAGAADAGADAGAADAGADAGAADAGAGDLGANGEADDAGDGSVADSAHSD
jgi:hypothetical protein